MKIICFYLTATLVLILDKINCELSNSMQDKLVYCKLEICNSFGGLCNGQGHCVCFNGFLTPDHLKDHIKCNYEQHNSKIAGLLETIFGCGTGHFYTGRKSNGTLKLFLIFLFCGCIMTTLVLIRKIRQEVEAEDHPYISLFVILVAVFKIVLVIWQIVDGMLFFFKVYKDGNGYDLI
jgi:hypothetical protein